MTKPLLTLLFASLILHGCISSSFIYYENDAVLSSKRIKWEYKYINRNRKSPLINLKQTVVKEIKSDGETAYKVYDILTLSNKSYRLDNKVYLIIDNISLPMVIESKEIENQRRISEDRENILTADSTSTSVVTGYSEVERKITKLSYKLSDEVIDKIQNSEEVVFQYYAGPSIITAKLKNNNLNKLKSIFNMQ